MASGFHNNNCTIENQVIGTLNISSRQEENLIHIHQLLDTILERLNTSEANSKADKLNALGAVEDIRHELANKSPNASVLDQSLRVVNGIASVSHIVEQIRLLLKNLF